MLGNQTRAFSIIDRYRYKHKGQDQSALDKIVWYSIPVVYPDWSNGAKQIRAERSKRHQKKKRVNKMLESMALAYNGLYFVTLTFTDEKLNSTNERTRHRYAVEWLNNNCLDYVANIDYGGKTQREHYHAVVALRDIHNLTEWQNGFKSVKSVSYDATSKQRLGKYLVKLTNHAGKVGSGRIFRKKGFREVDNLPF